MTYEAHTAERVRDAYNLLGDLLRGVDWALWDRCEFCRHRRIEHMPGRDHPHGREACQHGGCECADFLLAEKGNPLRAVTGERAERNGAG